MDTIANALIPIDIEQEMRNSYLDYSMSVIIGRALPDVRDGLKPVHRRILYAMFREGNLSTRRYSKCAGVVGGGAEEVPPTRRLCGLRRPRSDGAAVEHAAAPGRRTRKLRLHRR